MGGSKMKSCTNIQQSKKLAEILPLYSADMKYTYYGFGQYGITAVFGEPIEFRFSGGKDIPCWSLAALFNYLREIGFFPEIDADKSGVTMNAELLSLAGVHNIKVKAETFIDACYEMIIHLHELKML